MENVRTAENTVNLAFNPWDVPEDMAHMGHNISYTPDADAATKEAISRGLLDEGHLLTDFRCVRNYVTEILEGKVPDMDVYRSCAQSAVGILGWQSVLNGSKQYEIPDFRDLAARDLYRHDDRSPWKGDFPITMYPID